MITAWGGILSTEDGGLRWTVFGKIARGFVRNAVLLDSTHGWALVEQEPEWCVMRTTDGGRTWQESYRSSRRLDRMFFIHKDLGWVVGDGTVVRFTGAQ